MICGSREDGKDVAEASDAREAVRLYLAESLSASVWAMIRKFSK